MPAMRAAPSRDRAPSGHDFARYEVTLSCEQIVCAQHVVAEVVEVLPVVLPDPLDLAVPQLLGHVGHGLHFVLKGEQVAADVEQVFLQRLHRFAVRRFAGEDLALPNLDSLLERSRRFEAVVDERVEHPPDQAAERPDLVLLKARQQLLD